MPGFLPHELFQDFAVELATLGVDVVACALLYNGYRKLVNTAVAVAVSKISLVTKIFNYRTGVSDGA